MCYNSLTHTSEEVNQKWKETQNQEERIAGKGENVFNLAR